MSQSPREEAEELVVSFLRTLPVNIEARANEVVFEWHVGAHIMEHIGKVTTVKPDPIADNMISSLKYDKSVGPINWAAFYSSVFRAYGPGTSMNDQKLVELLVAGLEYGLAVVFLKALMPEHFKRCMEIMSRYDINDPYDALHEFTGRYLLKKLRNA